MSQRIARKRLCRLLVIFEPERRMVSRSLALLQAGFWPLILAAVGWRTNGLAAFGYPEHDLMHILRTQI
ncbi:hypothetical protein J2X16_000002 [Pelomonas aquatica]|uniref:Uncharacterized protein n=1 Tax=Pelomonas aquatica TaxID=431058 RepID=A0ABU1Z4I6_9BURK|nr:hypothetical protein [Pelomonas aquatica]MDR7294681.1 hypothetical protein [Pelomonas aquatica]